MSYRTYDRNPSGIVFFGTSPSDQAFESNANFTIDGTTLRATNLAVSNNGNIGNATYSNILNLGSDGQVTFSSGIIVQGDLTVNGNQVILNTQTLNVEDNIITLNANATGVAPSLNAGIQVERGTSSDVELRWNEGTDVWEFTDNGTTYYRIATVTGSETFQNKTISATNNTITNLSNTNLNGSAGITNANLANPNVTIGSTTIQLGATGTTLNGLVGVQATTFSGTLAGNANTATTATSASGLTSSVTIQLSNQLNGSATFQNAGSTANISSTLTTAAITGQVAATTGNDTDFLLIASGTELRKITKANFVAGLGAGTMTSWQLSAQGGSQANVTDGGDVDFSGAGSVTVSRNNLNIIISGTDTTYSAGTGLNLVGTTFNVSGSTTSNSGIVQLQDSIADNVTNRAVTPNAVFDYVATTSGSIDTRLVSTGNNLQTQINSVSGLLYNYWTLNVTGSNDQITKEQAVTFTGVGATSVTYNNSTNTVTITSTDTNTTYSAGTGLNLVGTTFNVSGSTTSNSGIVQLQDSVQDSITDRAITPNAVFDYVGSTSGALDTRLVSTGNNLQGQINSVSGLLYNYWTLNVTGSNDQITRQQTVTFTGTGATSVAYNSSTNTVTVSSTDTDTTYTAGSGLVLNSTTFDVQVDNSTLEIVTDTVRLKNTAVSAGTYGSPSAGTGVIITVDAQGRLISASNQAITVSNSNVTRTIETVAAPTTISKDITLVNGAVTVTLPDNATAGTIRVVKRIDSGAGQVTISRQTADTIDGATTKLLYYQYESMTFVSDGADWYVI